MSIGNAISIGRFLIALVILSANLFAIPLLAIQILFITGAISDKVDGWVSRRTKTVTKFGETVLEPIADGTLIWAGVIYLVRYSDFPMWTIPFGIGIVLSGFLAIVITRVLKKAWYTGPTLRVKAPVGIAFGLIALYLLNFPYVEIAIWLGAVLAVIAVIDLFGMLYRWKPPKKKSMAAKKDQRRRSQ